MGTLINITNVMDELTFKNRHMLHLGFNAKINNELFGMENPIPIEISVKAACISLKDFDKLENKMSELNSVLNLSIFSSSKYKSVEDLDDMVIQAGIGNESELVMITDENTFTVSGGTDFSGRNFVNKLYFFYIPETEQIAIVETY